jgi:hypothetical protein
MERIIIILTVLLLSSCSMERKLSRICRKSPELCQSSDTITTIEIDTIRKVVEYPVHDSIYITGPRDTIEVISPPGPSGEPRVITRIIREHDTLRVNQHISPDEILQIEKRIRQEVKTQYKWEPTWIDLVRDPRSQILMISSVLLALLISFILRKGLY